MATDPDLDRFKTAQNRSRSGFASALEELRTTGKRGHWIWYVFPQLAGLGFSYASRTYGIDDIAEAERFLQDPLLRSRLLAVTTAVAERVRNDNMRLKELMGSSIDTLKLISSLTLFAAVAGRLAKTGDSEEYASLAALADEVLAAAAAQGYPRCRYTMERLRASETTE